MLPLIPAVIQFGPFAIEYPHLVLAQTCGVALIAFLLFKFPIPYYSRKYYSNTLGERTRRIEQNQNQVDVALKEVSHLRDDYKSRIERIEQEARERIDQAVREAESARTEIVAEAQILAQNIKRRADEEVSRARTRQRILFRQELVQKAMDAAEHSIRTHSNDETQGALIQEFIDQVGVTPPSNDGKEGQ